MFHSNLVFASKDSRFFFIVNVNRQCYIFSESSHSDLRYDILIISKFSKVMIGNHKKIQKKENRAKIFNIIFIKKKLNVSYHAIIMIILLLMVNCKNIRIKLFTKSPSW